MNLESLPNDGGEELRCAFVSSGNEDLCQQQRLPENICGLTCGHPYFRLHGGFPITFCDILNFVLKIHLLIVNNSPTIPILCRCHDIKGGKRTVWNNIHVGNDTMFMGTPILTKVCWYSLAQTLWGLNLGCMSSDSR